MLERLAHFLLKKRANAACIAFFCGILSFFFASLSVIIVGLVTLRKGGREGFFVLGWGVLPFLAHAYVDENYLLLLLAALTFSFVWLMAMILRHYGSWSILLDVFALLSVAMILGGYFFQDDILSWWQQHITAYMKLVVARGYLESDEVLSQNHVMLIAKLATGIEMFFLFLMAWLKIIAARWWEGIVLKKRCYLHRELVRTSINRWVFWLLIVLSIVAFFSQDFFLASACIPIVGMYVLSGLCLLHYWLQDYKYAKLALFGFYVVVVIFPYIVGLIALLGLIDSGFKLREVHRGSHSIRKDS